MLLLHKRLVHYILAVQRKIEGMLEVGHTLEVWRTLEAEGMLEGMPAGTAEESMEQLNFVRSYTERWLPTGKKG